MEEWRWWVQEGNESIFDIFQIKKWEREREKNWGRNNNNINARRNLADCGRLGSNLQLTRHCENCIALRKWEQTSWVRRKNFYRAPWGQQESREEGHIEKALINYGQKHFLGNGNVGSWKFKPAWKQAVRLSDVILSEPRMTIATGVNSERRGGSYGREGRRRLCWARAPGSRGGSSDHHRGTSNPAPSEWRLCSDPSLSDHCGLTLRTMNTYHGE